MWFSEAGNSNVPQRCEFWDLETGKLRGTHPNAKCIGIAVERQIRDLELIAERENHGRRYGQWEGLA